MEPLHYDKIVFGLSQVCSQIVLKIFLFVNIVLRISVCLYSFWTSQALQNGFKNPRVMPFQDYFSAFQLTGKELVSDQKL